MQCNVTLALAHASMLHPPYVIPPLGFMVEFFRSDTVIPKKEKHRHANLLLNTD